MIKVSMWEIKPMFWAHINWAARRRSAFAIATLVVLQLHPSLAQEPQALVPSSMEGVVLDAVKGEPLARAQVTLTRIASQLAPREPAPGAVAASIPAVVTSSDGKFAFSNLPPGQYRIHATRNGFAPQEYGQRTLTGPGSVVNLVAGQTARDINFSLTPAGTITGRVREGSGEALVNATVTLMRASYNELGQRVLQQVRAATTDDRGEYRLFWISPGRYFVSIGGSASSLERLTLAGNSLVNDRTFPVTFYPGVTDPSRAIPIDVQSSAELGAINITVDSSALFRVRGAVVDAASGRPPRAVSFSLLSRQEIAGFAPGNVRGYASSYDAQTGRFELRNVLPGAYWLQLTQPSNIGDAITPGAAAAISSARTGNEILDMVLGGGAAATALVPMEVAGRDIENLVITMSPAITLQGRIVLDDGQGLASLSDADQIRIVLRSTLPGGLTTAQRIAAQLNGSFQIDGVASGEYRVAVYLPSQDMYVKEVQFERSDVLNNPLVVTSPPTNGLIVVLSTRAAQIDGIVVDAERRAVRAGLTVLVPDDPRGRAELYRTATVDSDGRFALRGITPGSYRLFAWEALENLAFYDPDVIARYRERGIPLRLEQSAKRTVEVRIIPAPE